MADASMGIRAHLAIGDAAVTDKPLEFSSENVRRIPTVRDTGGIRGTLSALDSRAREGTYAVSGSFTIPGPSPTELDSLLPYLTGSAKAGNDYLLTDAAKPSFYLQKDAGAKVFTYSGCKFSRAVFRSSQGNFLEAVMDVEGKSESVGAAGSFPLLLIDDAEPFMFHDCIFTIGGAAKEIIDIELTLDNAIFGDKYRNSQSRTQLPEGERIVTWRTTTPFTADEVALYTTAAVEVVATFTNGGFIVAFSSPAVRFVADTPSAGSHDEIVLGMTGRARRTVDDLELLISTTLPGLRAGGQPRG